MFFDIHFSNEDYLGVKMDLIKNLFTSNDSAEDVNQIDLLNTLMDIIINHIKQHHVKQFDPFILRERQTINVNPYVTVVMNSFRMTGATNFRKISNNTNYQLKGDKRLIIGTDIGFNDLNIDIKFDAKMGIPSYRMNWKQKTALISVKSCVFYCEIVIDLKQKFVKVNKVSLISNDRILCKTDGFIWPLNKTADTLIRKNIEQFISDNKTVLEDMVKNGANQYCPPHDLYYELKQIHDYMKIIKRINF